MLKRVFIRAVVGIVPLLLIFGKSLPFEHVAGGTAGALLVAFVIEELTRQRRTLRVAGLAGVGLAFPSGVLLTTAWVNAWIQGGPFAAYRFTTTTPGDQAAALPVALVSFLGALVLASLGVARGRTGKTRWIGVACAILVAALTGAITCPVLMPVRGDYTTRFIVLGGISTAFGALVLAGALALGDRWVKRDEPFRIEKVMSPSVVALLGFIFIFFLVSAAWLEEEHDARRRTKHAGKRLLALVMLQHGCRHEHLAGKRELPARFLTLAELREALPWLAIHDREFGYVFEMVPDKSDPTSRFRAVANPIVVGSGPSLLVDETSLPIRHREDPAIGAWLGLRSWQVFASRTRIDVERRRNEGTSQATFEQLEVGRDDLDFSWTEDGHVYQSSRGGVPDPLTRPLQFDDSEESPFSTAGMHE